MKLVHFKIITSHTNCFPPLHSYFTDVLGRIGWWHGNEEDGGGGNDDGTSDDDGRRRISLLGLDG